MSLVCSPEQRRAMRIGRADRGVGLDNAKSPWMSAPIAFPHCKPDSISARRCQHQAPERGSNALGKRDRAILQLSLRKNRALSDWLISPNVIAVKIPRIEAEIALLDT